MKCPKCEKEMIYQPSSFRWWCRFCQTYHKPVVALALVLALSGCSQLAGNTPSLQYCDSVSYVREGNRIELTASCQAPIGSSLLH